MRHLLSAFSLLLVCSAYVRADDWPLPYHDSANTCVSSERIRLPLRPAWRITGAPPLQMVAAKGRLYTVDWTRLVARDLRTGRELWAAPGNWASVCLYQDLVVVGVGSYAPEQLQPAAAFRASDGSQLWRLPAGAGDFTHGAVTVYQDRLYLANGGGLWELDPRTGETIARTADGTAGLYLGVPAFLDGSAYCGVGHYGYVVTLPGMQARTLGLWDAGSAYPIFWNGYLATQGPILRGHSFRLQEGRTGNVHTWYADKGVGHGIAPVGEGLVLEKDGVTGAHLVAYDLATGERRWVRPMIVTSMSSATQDLLFVVGNHRRPGWRRRPDSALLGDYAVLHVLDAPTGEVRAQYRLGAPDFASANGRAPLLAEGCVVVSVSDGLYCFRSR